MEKLNKVVTRLEARVVRLEARAKRGKRNLSALKAVRASACVARDAQALVRHGRVATDENGPFYREELYGTAPFLVGRERAAREFLAHI